MILLIPQALPWCELLLSLTAIFTGVTAKSTQQALFLSQEHDRYGPNIESTKANANIIFNAIHSAARQWGSSVHHNGLSLIPVTVPEGTLLYHGSPVSQVPNIPEWLAFEIEHAEHFARNFPGGRMPSNDETTMYPRQFESSNDTHHAVPRFNPGYLHIYQANRPLRLLYFDGMSAATASPLGPTDMQQMMFLNQTWEQCCHGRGIWAYAKAMCNRASEWGVEGFVRMEAGFEIIKCDFSNGLELLSTPKRPVATAPEGRNEGTAFGWLRGVALRYHGIDASRIIIDFSSMVHAGFYPTNLSNPKLEFSHLPRLASADPFQLIRIRNDVKELWLQGRPQFSVDWQGVVDMIVKRFGDRIQHLATDPSSDLFLGEINILLNVFIDYQSFSQEKSVNMCALHYLQPVKVSTEQDKLIYAAISRVTERICTTLFEIRASILAQDDTNIEHVVDTSKNVQKVKELIKWLDWSEWKMCRPSCLYDQVCYIAMLPFGTTPLHYNPRCLNSSEIEELKFSDDNYWFPDGIFPHYSVDE